LPVVAVEIFSELLSKWLRDIRNEIIVDLLKKAAIFDFERLGQSGNLS
jgi:hypothetical protein